MDEDTTKCIRCDTELPTGLSSEATLTWGHEEGAVRICDDCFEIAEERDIWN